MDWTHRPKYRNDHRSNRTSRRQEQKRSLSSRNLTPDDRFYEKLLFRFGPKDSAIEYLLSDDPRIRSNILGQVKARLYSYDSSYSHASTFSYPSSLSSGSISHDTGENDISSEIRFQNSIPEKSLDEELLFEYGDQELVLRYQMCDDPFSREDLLERLKKGLRKQNKHRWKKARRIQELAETRWNLPVPVNPPGNVDIYTESTGRSSELMYKTSTAVGDHKWSGIRSISKDSLDDSNRKDLPVPGGSNSSQEIYQSLTPGQWIAGRAIPSNDAYAIGVNANIHNASGANLEDSFYEGPSIDVHNRNVGIARTFSAAAERVDQLPGAVAGSVSSSNFLKVNPGEDRGSVSPNAMTSLLGDAHSSIASHLESQWYLERLADSVQRYPRNPQSAGFTVDEMTEILVMWDSLVQGDDGYIALYKFCQALIQLSSQLIEIPHEEEEVLELPWSYKSVNASSEKTSAIPDGSVDNFLRKISIVSDVSVDRSNVNTDGALSHTSDGNGTLNSEQQSHSDSETVSNSSSAMGNQGQRSMVSPAPSSLYAQVKKISTVASIASNKSLQRYPNQLSVEADSVSEVKVPEMYSDNESMLAGSMIADEGYLMLHRFSRDVCRDVPCDETLDHLEEDILSLPPTSPRENRPNGDRHGGHSPYEAVAPISEGGNPRGSIDHLSVSSYHGTVGDIDGPVVPTISIALESAADIPDDETSGSADVGLISASNLEVPNDRSASDDVGGRSRSGSKLLEKANEMLNKDNGSDLHDDIQELLAIFNSEQDAAAGSGEASSQNASFREDASSLSGTVSDYVIPNLEAPSGRWLGKRKETYNELSQRLLLRTIYACPRTNTDKICHHVEVNLDQLDKSEADENAILMIVRNFENLPYRQDGQQSLIRGHAPTDTNSGVYVKNVKPRTES